MKKILFLMPLALVSFSNYAQNTFPATGYVGIGTTTPSYNLEVLGTVKASTGIFSNEAPNGSLWNGDYQQRAVKCNVISAGALLDASWNYRTFQYWDFPQSDLDPNATIVLNLEDRTYKSRFSFSASSNSSSQLLLRDRNQEVNFRLDEDGNDNVVIDMPKANSRIVLGGWATYLPEHKLVVRGSSKIEGNILTDANIGIGTSSFTDGTDTYRLSVKGKVRAEEIKVYNTWADYVFEEDYKLRSLEEVETFIKENKHLPNVPSAQKITDNGLELGEMAKIQQEKIEELTLYLIEQNKEIEELKAQMKVLLEKK